ncbi:hypothetical protein ABZ470_31880 [Streptosporangium sp. NPDC020072]|uniref:hypothetical protein n=1 Tax=Streptosporangium sp. NPDC020072 TaxID=3154788 RepID=UPI00341A560D
MTKTKVRTTAFGLPVEGELYHPRSASKEQLGEDEFAKLIRPLINSPRVEAIRWEQFTPYFNDGDLCEFGISGARLKVNDRADFGEDDDYTDGFFGEYTTALKGGQAEKYTPGRWTGSTYTSAVWEPYGPVWPKHEDYGDFEKLADGIEAGCFDDYLYETFGDHAEVTVYKDRITVETYEHD